MFETACLNSTYGHTVGYSQSQQVFSFGLHKGPESFSLLVDRFIEYGLFKVSPQRPHICCRCHGNRRCFSTALNLLLASADELMKCNCLCQTLPTTVLFDEALPKSRRSLFFDSRCINMYNMVTTSTTPVLWVGLSSKCGLHRYVRKKWQPVK